MASIDRPLRGSVLVLDLDAERARPASAAESEPSARSARTLIKDGPLRLTMVVLAAGGEMREHRAEGPILIQPLEGEIEFTAGDETHTVRAGQLLSAGPGVPHAVRSEAGATFLLTVALPAKL